MENRIINVLTIEKGIPSEIKSFEIYEEQLSGEVIEEAENYFKKLIKENYKFTEEEDEDETLEKAVENGYFDTFKKSFYLIWSS